MSSPVDGVGGSGNVPSTAPAGSSSSTGDNSELSSQAFLQLLVAQLQYQDPSAPTDTSTLMNETATLNQIQTMQQLSAASTAATTAQQQQTATTMVGDNVNYLNSAGGVSTGFVSSATLTGTAPTLQINGDDVPLANIQQVLANAPAPSS
jgi:flagellar basal-body rod modification protein FlgD